MKSKYPLKSGQLTDKIANKEEDNVFIGQNEFEKPLVVATPTLDAHAVNKEWVNSQGFIKSSTENKTFASLLFATTGTGLDNGEDLPLIEEKYYGDEFMFGEDGYLKFTQNGLYKISFNLISDVMSVGMAGKVHILTPDSNTMVLEVGSDFGKQFYYSVIEEIDVTTGAKSEHEIKITNAHNTLAYRLFVEVEKIN